MKIKFIRILLVTAVALCLSTLSASAQVNYCSVEYCADKPSQHVCLCPATHRCPDVEASCGNWQMACIQIEGLVASSEAAEAETPTLLGSAALDALTYGSPLAAEVDLLNTKDESASR